MSGGDRLPTGRLEPQPAAGGWGQGGWVVGQAGVVPGRCRSEFQDADRPLRRSPTREAARADRGRDRSAGPARRNRARRPGDPGGGDMACADRNVCGSTDHHGSRPSFACENVPVGPSGPSSARRTASRAPSSTVSVPA